MAPVHRAQSGRRCESTPETPCCATQAHMEEEVRHILHDAVKEQNQHIAKLGSRIAARFTKTGLSTDLPELHGQIPRSGRIR